MKLVKVDSLWADGEAEYAGDVSVNCFYNFLGLFTRFRENFFVLNVA